MKVVKVKYTRQDFYKIVNNLILIRNTAIYYFINGERHCETGRSIISMSGDGEFFYKGIFYGDDNNFTNKSWKKFVKKQKRQEKLEIFI